MHGDELRRRSKRILVSRQDAVHASSSRDYRHKNERWSPARFIGRNTNASERGRNCAHVPSSEEKHGLRQRQGGQDGGRAKGGGMMRTVCGMGDFVRRIRIQARFGSLSRAPLQLLRFELRGDAAECEWIARPPDEWDASLPSAVRERNASRQALEDAITVRDLLLRALPDLESAVLHIYRQLQGESLELIVKGHVRREERAPAAVRSLAMRAKLYGFQFWLDDGVLEVLQTEDLAVNR
jgi:hypothetical protein